MQKSSVIIRVISFVTVMIIFLRLIHHSVSVQIKCPNTGIEMILVPEGKFMMGSPDHDPESRNNEKPQHNVYLESFYIDKYEISVAQFKKFVEEKKYKPLGSWENTTFKQNDNHPVVEVSWWDAIEYCNWRSRKEGLEPCYNETTGECDFAKKGYRLPTEAEWEKAARGNDGRKYPWGNDKPNSAVGYKANYSKKPQLSIYFYTVPVDAYETGRSPYGVYNMAGNVWEWCNDWYDENYYKESKWINPRGPKKGIYRVLRGGFWFSAPFELRTSCRAYDNPAYINEYYGFRCARNS